MPRRCAQLSLADSRSAPLGATRCSQSAPLTDGRVEPLVPRPARTASPAGIWPAATPADVSRALFDRCTRAVRARPGRTIGPTLAPRSSLMLYKISMDVLGELT